MWELNDNNIAFNILLLISGIRNLLIVITGFTIGHSITLSLAALEIM